MITVGNRLRFHRGKTLDWWKPFQLARGMLLGRRKQRCRRWRRFAPGDAAFERGREVGAVHMPHSHSKDVALDIQLVSSQHCAASASTQPRPASPSQALAAPWCLRVAPAALRIVAPCDAKCLQVRRSLPQPPHFICVCSLGQPSSVTKSSSMLSLSSQRSRGKRSRASAVRLLV